MKTNTQVCPLCDDTGWKSAGEGKERKVTRCDCRQQERTQRLLAQARIPKRYEHCELANFKTPNDSLVKAKLAAEAFVDIYPVHKTGLLFVGPIGVGKTHVAVSLIRELIIRKGIACLFWDYRDLMKQIQDSYNRESEKTELAVLQPIFECEVLLLDELGAVKPTEWVFNTVTHILNARYNGEKTTIITTNFPDAPPARSPIEGVTNTGRAYQANVEETLGDRVGERVRSRLHEMCTLVEMCGQDYRTRRVGPR